MKHNLYFSVFSISCCVKYLYQTPHSPTCRGFPTAAVPARQPDGVSGEGGLPQVSFGGDDHLQRPLRHQGTALQQKCQTIYHKVIDMSILNRTISVIFCLPVSLLKMSAFKMSRSHDYIYIYCSKFDFLTVNCLALCCRKEYNSEIP